MPGVRRHVIDDPQPEDGMRSRWLALVVWTAVVAGCGGSPASSVGPSPSVPTAPASAGPRFSGTVADASPTVFRSPLTFAVPMTVSYGPGWSILENLPDLITLQSSVDDFQLSFNIVTKATMADPGDGHPIPFPTDLAGWLRADPDLRVDASTPVTIAGIAGIQVDTTTLWTSSGDNKTLLTLPDNGWNLVPKAEQWRFIFLDNVNGQRLLILTIANPGTLASAAARAQAVIDTVTFAK
jgi:hypothetical protein